MSVATKYFTVTAPQGISTLKLDSKGCATCQITVKNVSRTVIDGRAILVSLPIVNPRAGAVEKNWIKIDGATDRHFPVDQEEVFSVKIAVPQKKGEAPAAGNYSFRLDVVNIARPDDSGDQSQALGFAVAAPPPEKPSRWPLIAVVAALVLIVGGVTTWLLTRGTPVPDLSGKTTTEAFTILADAKLILDPNNVDHVDSTPENSGKIVSQKPEAGKKAKSGSVVQVTLGSPMVSMPTLLGHTFPEAQALANKSGLGAITSTTAASPDHSAKGVVFDQTPLPGVNVRTGTAVSLKITPQDIPIISVVGQTYSDAYASLQRAGLSVGTIQGDHNQRVSSQNPVGGMVPVGTRVNLVFPCGPFGIGCAVLYTPATAQQLYVDRTGVRTTYVK
jgi:beta-lactam-binding protein with PASTA domain